NPLHDLFFQNNMTAAFNQHHQRVKYLWRERNRAGVLKKRSFAFVKLERTKFVNALGTRLQGILRVDFGKISTFFRALRKISWSSRGSVRPYLELVLETSARVSQDYMA